MFTNHVIWSYDRRSCELVCIHGVAFCHPVGQDSTSTDCDVFLPTERRARKVSPHCRILRLYLSRAARPCLQIYAAAAFSRVTNIALPGRWERTWTKLSFAKTKCSHGQVQSGKKLTTPREQAYFFWGALDWWLAFKLALTSRACPCETEYQHKRQSHSCLSERKEGFTGSWTVGTDKTLIKSEQKIYKKSKKLPSFAVKKKLFVLFSRPSHEWLPRSPKILSLLLFELRWHRQEW